MSELVRLTLSLPLDVAARRRKTLERRGESLPTLLTEALAAGPLTPETLAWFRDERGRGREALGTVVNPSLRSQIEEVASLLDASLSEVGGALLARLFAQRDELDDVVLPFRRGPRSFDFIELFAGIGGFRFGLEPLGGRCVYTSEWDRYARATYAAWHNVDDDHLFDGDITEVDPSVIPEHAVLTGGFPCQPFSLAGVSKKNALGRDHGFEDPAQGTLFFNIREIAKEKRPSLLLLENVKHLRSHDAGRTWRIIQDELRRIDYVIVHDDIVDARHWVPQHRERIMIAAIDARRHPWVKREGARRTIPLPTGSQPTLGSILDDDVPGRYTLSERLWQYLQAYRAKHEARGNGFGYSLFGPDDVARTMSARYHKDGSEILIRQDGRPRRLTPREAQRLMGFSPDQLRLERDLPIVVSDTQAYRQFGNAVVPAVVRHVADPILRLLDVQSPGWADRDTGRHATA